MEKIGVTRLGAAAEESMKGVTGGRVAGVTSKGAFLRAADRIFFLTAADYRSPFNLTLERVDHLFSALQPGDAFEITAEGISFPGREFTLITTGAEVWQPPPPAKPLCLPAQQKERVTRLIEHLQDMDDRKGFLYLANPVDELTTVDQRDLYYSASTLKKSFKAQDKTHFLASAQRLLGAGGGLTPSGDDFLAGFFLFHFRCLQAGATVPGFLVDWCAELTRLAYEKTTTISANRLEYSARGWSEELFLQLIDHLFNPDIQFDEEMVRRLLEFGHSSGVDTLMGISFAVDSLL